MLVNTGSTQYSAGHSIVEELNLYETPYRVEEALTNGRRISVKLFLAKAGAKGRRVHLCG